MSVIKIRAALEGALKAIDPVFSTAYENVPFNPVAGTPYQKVNLLLAPPNNPSMGSGFFQVLGVFQVTLFYPLLAGTADAGTRADLLQTSFKRGNSYVKDDHVVTISKTPEIANGSVDGDRWMIPIKIPFHSNLMT